MKNWIIVIAVIVAGILLINAFIGLPASDEKDDDGDYRESTGTEGEITGVSDLTVSIYNLDKDDEVTVSMDMPGELGFFDNLVFSLTDRPLASTSADVSGWEKEDNIKVTASATVDWEAKGDIESINHVSFVCNITGRVDQVFTHSGNVENIWDSVDNPDKSGEETLTADEYFTHAYMPDYPDDDWQLIAGDLEHGGDYSGDLSAKVEVKGTTTDGENISESITMESQIGIDLEGDQVEIDFSLTDAYVS